MNNETILNGRYRLIAQQGSGGMAVIYKAIDQALGRTVAIKILRPSLTGDPAFLARFRNEARSVANLMHPNIVTVHDVGNDGATYYIVMEFVEGNDLKKVIKSEGALDIDRMINLTIQICAGIGFAHRANLVHADVKPQNILVTRDQAVKVTDFGIAQALSDTQPGERQAVVWGSPHYFAPEQAKGEKPTTASDVYSIGIVMFELLSGRLPYTGANQQELALAHIREPIPMVTDFNPSVPQSLAQIVYKTMSKEPSQRYRMADQLQNVLIAYRNKGGESVPAPTSSIPLTAAPPSQSLSPSASWVSASPPPAAVTQPGTAAPNAYSRPVDPIPTERVDLAPQAPGGYDPNAYNVRGNVQQNAQPQPYPGNNAPFSTQAPYNMSPNNQGNYASQPIEVRANALDGVTIALAALAFFAVACLIPLYIAVFGARFGG